MKDDRIYLYRAADATGQTIDFLLTEHRDQKAANRFLAEAIGRNGTPVRCWTDDQEEIDGA